MIDKPSNIVLASASSGHMSVSADVNTAGENGFFEIPLVDSFAGLGFPISIVIPANSKKYPLNYRCLSFCWQVQFYDSASFLLRRPGLGDCTFAETAEGGAFRCSSTGEYAERTTVGSAHYVAVLTHNGSRYYFEDTGDQAVAFIELQSGARLSFSQQNGQGSLSFDYGAGRPLHTLSFAAQTGGGGWPNYLRSISVKKTRGNETITSLDVDIELFSNGPSALAYALSVTRHPADSQALFERFFASAGYDSVSGEETVTHIRYVSRACGLPDSSLAFSPLGNELLLAEPITGAFTGNAFVSRGALASESQMTEVDNFELQLLSQRFVTLERAARCQEERFALDASDARRIIGQYDLSGTFSWQKYDSEGRLIERSDAVRFQKEGESHRSLLRNGFFESLAGWTISEGVVGTTVSHELSHCIGNKALRLGTGAFAKAYLGSLPGAGEPCLAAALVQAGGASLTLTVKIEYGAEDEEVMSSSIGGQEAPLGRIAMVSVPFAPKQRPLRVSVTVSSGGDFATAMAVQVFSGSSKRILTYSADSSLFPERESYGGVSTGYVGTGTKVEYCFGGSRSPIRGFVPGTELPSSYVGDLGETKTIAYETLASQNPIVRVPKETILSTENGSFKEARSFDLSYGLAASATKGGRTVQYEYDGADCLVAAEDGAERSQRMVNAFGLPDTISKRKLPSGTAYTISFTYDDYGRILSVGEGGSVRLAFGYDDYDSPDEIGLGAASSRPTAYYEYRHDLQDDPLERQEFGPFSEEATYDRPHDDQYSPEETSFAVKEGATTEREWQYSYDGPEFLSTAESSDGRKVYHSFDFDNGEETEFSEGQDMLLSLRENAGSLEAAGGSFRALSCEGAGAGRPGDDKTLSLALEHAGWSSTQAFLEGDGIALHALDAAPIEPSVASSASRQGDFGPLWFQGNGASYSFGIPLPYPFSTPPFAVATSFCIIGTGSQLIFNVALSAGGAAAFLADSGMLTLNLSGTPTALCPLAEGRHAIVVSSSSDSLRIAVDGVLFTVQAGSSLGTMIFLTLSASNGVSYHHVAAKRTGGEVSREELLSICLAEKDCVLAAGLVESGVSGTSYRSCHLSAPSEPFLQGLERLVFDGMTPEAKGTRIEGQTLPQLIGDDGPLSPGFVRGSPFEYSPSLSTAAWRAFGGRLEYRVADASTMAVALRIELSALPGSATKRHILESYDPAFDASLYLLGTRLWLAIDATALDTGIDLIGAGPFDAALSLTFSAPSGTYSPTYQLSYRVFAAGSSYGGSAVKRARPTRALLCIGNSSLGSSPLYGLVSELALVRRDLSAYQLSVLASGQDLLSRRTIVDALGRPSGRVMRRARQPVCATAYGYATRNGFDTNAIASSATGGAGAPASAHAYSYDAAMSPDSLDSVPFRHDARGFLTDIQGWHMAYDGAGNITSITDGQTTRSFTYAFPAPGIGLFYSAAEGSAKSVSFTYNGMFPSTVTRIGLGSDVKMWLSYAAGRLKSAQLGAPGGSPGPASVRYRHDDNGFLESVETMAYGQTQSVERFRFDSLGRLLWDGRPDGSELYYSYGEDGSPLAVTYSGQTKRSYLILLDDFGRIASLLGEGLTDRVDYSYDPWGVPATAYDGTPIGLGSKNRLLFKGYLYDAAMGAYFLGKRHYDPWIGRFWEPDDPIFLGAARFAGTNPYAYCFNDPVAYADITGHLGILASALIGLAIGAILSGAFELSKQLCANNGNWTSLDWVSIGRQAIIGGALGFAGGAGGVTLGGLLGGTTTITGAQVAAWLSISSAVSFAGGIGAYAAETFGHSSEWSWGEAISSGLMGMAAGMMAYGAGAVSKLVLGSNRMTRFILKQGVNFIFKFPLQFVEGTLIDYLS